MLTKSPMVLANRARLRPNTGVTTSVFMIRIPMEQDLKGGQARRTTSCPAHGRGLEALDKVLVGVETHARQHSDWARSSPEACRQRVSQLGNSPLSRVFQY